MGPLFNARSCASCHFKDGRGRPPEFDGEAATGFLVRLSTRDRDLTWASLPEPNYGGQFQDTALEEIDEEGDLILRYEYIEGEFADGSPYELRRPVVHFENLADGEMHPEVLTSARVGSQLIGLGLLEAIPEARLLELADPNDADQDGISGRPNYVWDEVSNRQVIGRFGWKANQPNILQQTATAFHGDLGITTSIFPQQNCSPVQKACEAEYSREAFKELPGDEREALIDFLKSL